MLVLVVTAASLQSARFFEATSISSLLSWIPLLLVIGVGQMFVIVSRGIDVSVGSMTGLSAMAVGMIFRANPHLPMPMGIACGVGMGFLLGSINGLLISRFEIPPIIATLGTLSAYRGLIFIVSHGVQVDSNNLPDSLTRLASEGPLQVGPYKVSWLLTGALFVAVLAARFARQTRLGRDIYTLGSNPEAARLRGVPIQKTLFWVYALTGTLCGVAGTILAARFGFVNPGSAGQGLELVVIAAVVIGGTNVTGGCGTVQGVTLGCLIIAAINVSLAVLGIDELWQQLVYGLVILVAVLVDTWAQRVLPNQGSVAR